MPGELASIVLDAPTAVLVSWAGAALLMGALWLRSLRTSDAGIVDVGWSAGLGLAAIFHAAVGDGDPLRRALVGALGALWGFRLALHIAVRSRGHDEDPRYRVLRERWGARADARMLLVFQAQAVLVALLALSFLVVARTPRPALGWPEAAGVALWAIAVGGEWLADRQLARFKADPGNRGRTCRAGLWRWSRHPNYFFEWIHWLAYVPLAWGSAWWPLTLLAPALMYVLLTRVTGLPTEERRSPESRADDSRRYQRSTHASLTAPPRPAPAGEAGA